tara:strand:- start:116 stop:367 length:252 start_codon:yes stop_codon:yes gene_type:complete
MNKGILYFSAPWCGPCTQLTPIIDSLKNINVRKINVDYDADLTQRYNVKSVPTLVLTDLNGKELKRLQGGGKSREEILNWYNG